MSVALDINVLEKEIRELEFSLQIRESWLNTESSSYTYFRQKHLYDSKRLVTLKRMADIIRLQSSAG